jgi:hypothetical protein
LAVNEIAVTLVNSGIFFNNGAKIAIIGVMGIAQNQKFFM